MMKNSNVRKIQEREMQKVLNNQEPESDALKSMPSRIGRALSDDNAANGG